MKEENISSSSSPTSTNTSTSSKSAQPKKKRVSLACIRCKGRKTKCDGKKPCGTCIASKNDCVYQVYGDMRKSKVNSEYLDYLAYKNHALVDFIKCIELKHPDISDAAREVLTENKITISSSVSDFNFEERDINSGNLLSERPESDALYDLSLINAEPINDTVRDTYFGSNLSLLSASPTGIVNNNINININHNNNNNKAMNYFANINADTILSNSEFVRSTLEMFRNYRGRWCISFNDIDYEKLINFRHSSTLPKIDYKLLCACTAFGLTYSMELYRKPLEAVLMKEAGDNIFELVMMNSVKEGRVVNPDDLKKIMLTLLLLAIYELGNGDDYRTWTYNSLLISQLQHYGYHILTEPTLEDSRFFWSVVLVDRIIANILGRNSALNYKTIMTRFYECSLGQQSSIDEKIFKYTTKLGFIHNKYTELFYSVEFNHYSLAHKKNLFIDAKNAMTEFYSNIPPEMMLNVESIHDSKIVMFHITYKVCTLTLRRPYLGCDVYGKLVIAECLRTCDEVLQLVSMYNNLNTFQCSPIYYSFLLFSVGIFQLSILTQPYAILFDTKERFFFVINSLKSLSLVWKRSDIFLRTILNHAYKWKLEKDIIDQILMVINQEDQMALSKNWTERFTRDKGAEKYDAIEKTFVPLTSSVFM